MGGGLSIGRSSSVQGGKFEEAEYFKFVFVVYYALKSNRSSPVCDLLRSHQLR